MHSKLRVYISFVFLIAARIFETEAAKYLTEKPGSLTPCHTNYHNFSVCFAKNFQVLFSEWRDGVPGLKSVGSFDPLYVKHVRIAQDPNNPVALNAELSNVVVKGASKAIVKEASVDTKNMIVKLKVLAPKLRLDNDYKLKGRILNLPLNGNGKSYYEADDVLLNIVINLRLRDQDGFTFSEIENLKLTIQDVGGFRIRLDNLFNGQRVLEESTNAAFNQNWRDFYEVLKPAITETMQSVLSDRFKKVFAYIPANYFIEDITTAAEYYG